jgi:DNA helicase-2/ATP-dependent DNA helicase PcrA
MRDPTPEQEAALLNTSRVRVIRATPGSGKTWLVAELIRRELVNWDAESCGVAALSFTRVGGDEIRKAVGHVLAHPHFVGTIDAFLFRYVIRPFLRACFPEFPEPRLVPGEWGAERWYAYGASQAMVAHGSVNLFGCAFVGEEGGTPVVAHTPHLGSGLQLVPGPAVRAVLDGKTRMWRQNGCLTHSDAALWASRVLDHPGLGLLVRREIVSRFPLLIVDELQDTGYFLGKSIRLLLESPGSRGVLVGDPDQSIFEFSGAKPELFASFEAIAGADTCQLGSSLRCPEAVVRAAKHTKDSAGDVVAAARPGRAVLIHGADPSDDARRIADAVAVGQGGRVVRVIARSRATVASISGRAAEEPPLLGSRPLNHMTRAVAAFRQGRQARALAATQAALSYAVFHYEGATADDLAGRAVDAEAWKELSVRCLLSTNAMDTGGTVHDWQQSCGGILEDELSQFGLRYPDLGFASGRLHPKRLPGWDTPVGSVLPEGGAANPWPESIPVETVHGVKGETHDLTIFVCPSASAAHCVSRIWWSADRREERRIAYVAMTRTQGDLVLCVDTGTYSRLATVRPEFVADLECMTVEEFLALEVA